MEDSEIYSAVIHQKEDGFEQTRLVINRFRGVEYLQIRKYFLAFEGDWQPSNKGLSIPLEIESTRELFKALAEVISLAESKEVIEEYFGDIIRDAYK
jgi:hypothetical protein